MTKYFNYNLIGTGWAEAFFSSDTQNIRFDISYLSDPLSDIFEGLYRLINNQSDIEKIIFAEEPGEHCLIISRQSNDSIKIEIFWNDEWEEISRSYNTTAGRELVYADTDTIKNFTSVICIGIESLLDRLTLAEYKEKWHLFEFPIEKYKKLLLLLN